MVPSRQSYYRTNLFVSLIAFNLLLGSVSFLPAQGRRPTAPQGNSQKPKTGPGADYQPLGQWKVAPIDRSKAGQVQQSARKIDQLIEANYQKYQVKPSPETTDEQFVRRIYLDITGTIPTLSEAKAFLGSTYLSKL